MRRVISNSSQHRPNTINRPPVLSRLLLLWIALAPLAGILALIDPKMGLSVLWGYSVNVLPSICFAWYSLKYFGSARRSRAMVSSLYRAEALKFVLTVVLFSAVFMQVDSIYPLIFFLAYGAAQVATWVITARALAQRH